MEVQILAKWMTKARLHVLTGEPWSRTFAYRAGKRVMIFSLNILGLTKSSVCILGFSRITFNRSFVSMT